LTLDFSNGDTLETDTTVRSCSWRPDLEKIYAAIQVECPFRPRGLLSVDRHPQTGVTLAPQRSLRSSIAFEFMGMALCGDADRTAC